MTRKYQFKYLKIPVFSGYFLLSLLSKDFDSFLVDGSLGKNLIHTAIRIDRDNICFDNICISKADLKDLVNNKRKIYALEKENIVPLSIFDSFEGKFYQLVLFKNNRTPTLEISGIHMHRTVVDPLFEDAKFKVEILNPRPNSLTLEICTGLGYTTYWLLKRKQRVFSIEKSNIVLELAQYNPWSSHLEDANVIIINDDATKAIEKFPSKHFDYILHDPPRISIAPELYSIDFYREIYRVLKSYGKFFHYVGNPGYKRGKKYIKGIIERLRLAGFRKILYYPKVLGLLAIK